MPLNQSTPQSYNADYQQQVGYFKRGQLFIYLRSEKLLICPADNVYNNAFYGRRNHLTSYGVDLSNLSFPGGGSVTAENLRLHGHIGHLYGHLLARGWIVPIVGVEST